MKLWDKGFSTDKKIDHFTVGNDRELDLHLAKYDVIASKAHAKMLGKIGLLTQKETDDLIKELNHIEKSIQKGEFVIEDSFEDMHSKIEYILTEKLGDTGKKIHTNINSHALAVNKILDNSLFGVSEVGRQLLPAWILGGQSLGPVQAQVGVSSTVVQLLHLKFILLYKVSIDTVFRPFRAKNIAQLIRANYYFLSEALISIISTK